MVVRILVISFVIFCFAASAATQDLHKWFLRSEVGRQRLHESADDTGKWPQGWLLGAHLYRHIVKPLFIGVSISHGEGRDEISVGIQQSYNFSAFEFGIEAHLLPGQRVNFIAAAGLGVMQEESFSTLSGPYYASVAAEVSLTSHHRVRATLRHGRHMNFGDSGTWPGPSVLSLGWVYAF